MAAALVSGAAGAVEAVPAAAPAAAAPGAGPSQHEVVHANTLWDLSKRYCNDPWQWPRIHAANRGKIKDPNLIYPGQVFVIPCVGKTVAVYPVTAAAPAPAQPAAPAPEEAAPEPAPEPVPRASEPEKPPLDDLSTRLPGGMAEQYPSVRRLKAPAGWGADGKVLELGDREFTAAQGDLVAVAILSGAAKGRRYAVYREAAPTESDADQKARYLQRIGTVEISRKLAIGRYQALIVKSGGTVQEGDLLKRE
ncbi:MAG TPA: LysM peptidoglycan-binding domain-containing protein [Elusimicrobiota bacterium]|nr:LysM peptidoglycan-binding domain-containing protein [Elusimicrobiota bacterium]